LGESFEEEDQSPIYSQIEISNRCFQFWLRIYRERR